MSIARRMTAEEILSLPQGSVVWYEDRFIYDNAEEGVCGIPAYFLYPIMVAEAGKDFALIGAREGCCPQTWLPKDLPFMVIWDKKPDRKQLKGFYHWDIDYLSDKALLEMTESYGTGVTALRKRVAWEFGSVTAFALCMRMNPRTLLRKLNGKVEFKYSEITAITQALGLSSAEVTRYFFPEEQPTEKIS